MTLFNIKKDKLIFCLLSSALFNINASQGQGQLPYGYAASSATAAQQTYTIYGQEYNPQNAFYYPQEKQYGSINPQMTPTQDYGYNFPMQAYGPHYFMGADGQVYVMTDTFAWGNPSNFGQIPTATAHQATTPQHLQTASTHTFPFTPTETNASHSLSTAQEDLFKMMQRRLQPGQSLLVEQGPDGKLTYTIKIDEKPITETSVASSARPASSLVSAQSAGASSSTATQDSRQTTQKSSEKTLTATTATSAAAASLKSKAKLLTPQHKGASESSPDKKLTLPVNNNSFVYENFTVSLAMQVPGSGTKSIKELFTQGPQICYWAKADKKRIFGHVLNFFSGKLKDIQFCVIKKTNNKMEIFLLSDEDNRFLNGELGHFKGAQTFANIPSWPLKKAGYEVAPTKQSVKQQAQAEPSSKSHNLAITGTLVGLERLIKKNGDKNKVIHLLNCHKMLIRSGIRNGQMTDEQKQNLGNFLATIDDSDLVEVYTSVGIVLPKT